MTQAKTFFLALVVGGVVSGVFAAPAERSFVRGSYFLTLDGVKCGFVKSVDGGEISAEVINEPAGPDYFVKKHIGQPKYGDFQVQVGFSMTKKMYEWIAQSWTQAHPRANGSIVALDSNSNAVSERQFTQALLTETTIPAIDSSSKEPSYLTVKLAPETIRMLKGGSKSSASENGQNEQKMWLPCNFRLQIDGLDCSRVSKIDSFTVKQTASSKDIGDARDYAKEPGKVEFPNLKITLPEASAQSWTAWHEDFVLKGNNDQMKEKNGTLTLLSPNRKEELLRIQFFNMGIFRLQNDKTETGAESIRHVVAELYVEKMVFDYTKNVIGSETQDVRPETVLATATPTK